jgi:hypothetical protein
LDILPGLLGGGNCFNDFSDFNLQNAISTVGCFPREQGFINLPMMAVKKRRQRKTLSAGRPPTIQRPKSITRTATKALINKHHLLEKRKQQAISKGDKAEEALIASEIESLGGLGRYRR